ncbi:unnamed protein product [Cuscuta campestris]|uniref:Uncharacterized protein n=1 Tax=Cuscuta campestris TaxID=132261 RepID=A0A484LZW6_9ASTE|nr:unnamed protein product [Cuscuta campestris]
MKKKWASLRSFKWRSLYTSFPQSWEDFPADLKFKMTELNLKQLLTHLRIQEEGLAWRTGGANANIVEHSLGYSHSGKD